jgi:hypothetical protein
MEVAALFASGGLQGGAAALERVRDVLEEDEAENQVLVFGGLDAAPQPIACLPKLFRKGKVVALGATGAVLAR